MDKNTLRQAILAERNKLTARDVADKSEIIAGKVLKMAEYIRANTIMIYLAFRNEVSTEPIIQHALKENKRVTAPVTNTSDKSMELYRILNYPGDLAPGAYGILQPAVRPDQKVVLNEVDLVVVPGAVFDSNGNRMGYGGGYYDRFLPRLRKDAVTIALAYDFQVLGDIRKYMSNHDYPVQFVLTDRSTIKCRSIP